MTKKEILECRIDSFGLSELMKKHVWNEIDNYVEEVLASKVGQHETKLSKPQKGS